MTRQEIYHALGEDLPWGGCSVEELIGRVRGEASRIALSGLVGGALAWLVSRLLAAFPDRPVVVVAPEPQRAYQIYEDIQFFCGEDPHAALSRLSYYAADEILPYSEMMPDRGAIQSRLCGLLQLQHRHFPVMVMPAAALLRRVLPKPVLSRASDLIAVAEELERDKLLHHLVQAGYQRVPVVEDRGTFSVRGAVVDIFSPLYRFPARVELDDQLVMSIRHFEPTTQRTVCESEELLVGPVDELLRTPENLSWANRRFAAQADILHYPTREWRQLLDDIREDVRPFGSQGMIPGFYEQLESLFSYLPKETLLILDEPRDILLEARAYTERMQESYAALCAEGRFAFPPEDFLLPTKEIESSLRRVCRIEHQSVFLLGSSAEPTLTKESVGSDASTASGAPVFSEGVAFLEEVGASGGTAFSEAAGASASSASSASSEGTVSSEGLASSEGSVISASSASSQGGSSSQGAVLSEQGRVGRGLSVEGGGSLSVREKRVSQKRAEVKPAPSVYPKAAAKRTTPLRGRKGRRKSTDEYGGLDEMGMDSSEGWEDSSSLLLDEWGDEIEEDGGGPRIGHRESAGEIAYGGRYGYTEIDTLTGSEGSVGGRLEVGEEYIEEGDDSDSSDEYEEWEEDTAVVRRASGSQEGVVSGQGGVTGPVVSVVMDEAQKQAERAAFLREARRQVGGVRFGDAGELLMPYVSLSQEGLKQLLRSIPASQEHRLQPLIERIKMWQAEGLVVVIACGTKGQALRLRELLELYAMSAQICEDGFSMESLFRRDAPRHLISIYLGRISEGFVFPRARLATLSEEEIFGPKARRSKTKKKGILLETELQSLQVGDLVIHREHGMARYGGLHAVQMEGVRGDFLLLEYHGSDRLYLPVTKLHLIERHTGGGDPPLDRLKSNTFEKKKTKARAAIQAIAGDLLKLYATRQLHSGEPIEISPELYAEFEARFPYEETPDQAQAIQDVLEDMRSPRCMDRLVCGDVGYGKTEVAIRAAFVAAFSGRQVAVLVPTTVLAQQHGATFMERFDGYPIKIAVLSRFQSEKDQKESLRLLGAGKIDVVIGTHRLLSRDVHFKNLGLLIVDEEQRFGVKHKERIKQFRSEVDVLTLTATPIPRTLEMSMVGARDLSLITTPPVDRLAIRTTVAPLSDEIVREAVMRELHRGGQVFFVHNRVEDIGKMQAWLHSIVPEARVIVAHGQMPEGDLERVMLDFVQGRYNILLCTSIIESGLDIPRANTILVNRADAFGLAQLYQIRGRVGRGRERAYAVLLVPPDARINPEAKQRLATLQRFTELGAGFEIARHDLEMRGAGNLLGKEQSGHIHAIGLELYMEMLQEAVAELQGKPVDAQIDPEVKLGIDAYLSDDYVPDIQLRLQCYRRLSTAVDTDELDQLSEEFVDRFGPLPRESERLFQSMEIRLLLKALFATSGELSGEKFRVFFHPQAPLDHERLLAEVQKKEPLFRLLPQGAIESIAALDKKDPFASIRSFLRPLPTLILRRPAS
ncbi:transcription-repair coupling factor [Myxococcota bacterium]|nr:transcription-repair coupling factor [Myxococcota bacterium]